MGLATDIIAKSPGYDLLVVILYNDVGTQTNLKQGNDHASNQTR